MDQFDIQLFKEIINCDEQAVVEKLKVISNKKASNGLTTKGLNCSLDVTDATVKEFLQSAQLNPGEISGFSPFQVAVYLWKSNPSDLKRQNIVAAIFAQKNKEFLGDLANDDFELNFAQLIHFASGNAYLPMFNDIDAMQDAVSNTKTKVGAGSVESKGESKGETDNSSHNLYNVPSEILVSPSDNLLKVFTKEKLYNKQTNQYCLSKGTPLTNAIVRLAGADEEKFNNTIAALLGRGAAFEAIDQKDLASLFNFVLLTSEKNALFLLNLLIVRKMYHIFLTTDHAGSLAVHHAAKINNSAVLTILLGFAPHTQTKAKNKQGYRAKQIATKTDLQSALKVQEIRVDLFDYMLYIREKIEDGEENALDRANHFNRLLELLEEGRGKLPFDPTPIYLHLHVILERLEKTDSIFSSHRNRGLIWGFGGNIKVKPVEFDLKNGIEGLFRQFKENRDLILRFTKVNVSKRMYHQAPWPPIEKPVVESKQTNHQDSSTGSAGSAEATPLQLAGSTGSENSKAQGAAISGFVVESKQVSKASISAGAVGSSAAVESKQINHPDSSAGPAGGAPAAALQSVGNAGPKSSEAKGAAVSGAAVESKQIIKDAASAGSAGSVSAETAGGASESDTTDDVTNIVSAKKGKVGGAGHPASLGKSVSFLALTPKKEKTPKSKSAVSPGGPAAASSSSDSDSEPDADLVARTIDFTEGADVAGKKSKAAAHPVGSASASPSGKSKTGSATKSGVVAQQSTEPASISSFSRYLLLGAGLLAAAGVGAGAVYLATRGKKNNSTSTSSTPRPG